MHTRTPTSGTASVRFWLTIGFYIGMYEVARILFFSPPEPYSLQHALYLALSGIISYSILGGMLGLIVSCMWWVARHISFLRRKDLDHSSLFFAAGLSVVMCLASGLVVNIFFLPFIKLFHPLSIVVNVVLITIFGFGGTALMYLVVQKVRTHLSSLVPTNITPSRVRIGIAVFPIVVIVLSFFLPKHQSAHVACRIEHNVEGHTASAPAAAQPQRPLATTPYNVLLVTIECLRADHLNCYGYRERDVSPFIDRFASQSTLFLRNCSQSAWTKASMASIFTSLHPSRHGATSLFSTIPPDLSTLPKVLHDAGYVTISFCTNPLAEDPAYGFQAQCRSGYASHAQSGSFPPLFLSSFLHWHLLSPVLVSKIRFLIVPEIIGHDSYVDGKSMNRCVATWLEQSRTEPFLLHIHYNDPHDPYLEHPYRFFQINTQAQWNLATLQRRFDSEIRFLDEALEDLIGMFHAHGILERTLVILVADHGEEFLDHGGWRHTRTLFEELIHVPLIIRFPDGRWKGTRVPQQVRSIDIAPTILDTLGIKVPVDMEGKSLLPLLRGQETDHRPAVSQTQTPMFALDCIIRYPFKYIERSQRGRTEAYLFDLEHDPKETTDITHQRSALVQDLARDLKAMTFVPEQAKAHRKKQVPVDDLTRKRLKALGYVN